jgi:type IV pilus assembly protein PilQ
MDDRRQHFLSPVVGFLLSILSLYSTPAWTLPLAEKIIAVQPSKKAISLNLKEVKIRDALQLLAEWSGFNLIIDEKIQGKLSIRLNNVPWEEALALILNTQNLVKKPIDKGWFILSKESELKRQEVSHALAAKQMELSELSTKLIPVYYCKATDVAELLMAKKNSFLSPRGSLSIDKRHNCLWVQDTPSALQKIEAAIRTLDKPIKQVSIEARIVSLDKDKGSELGARLRFKPVTLNIEPTFNASPTSKNSKLNSLNMDLPLMSATNRLDGGNSTQFRLGRLGANIFLDLELTALENEGGAQVISAPHLTVEDQQTALIETGASIPYQEKTASGATNVNFKKAVLSLKVIPRIMPDQHLFLELEVNQDQPTAIRVLDMPAIHTRRIKTKVFINNGETIVLGGIYENFHSQSVERVPFLGSLPILGRLFSNHKSVDKRNELLIFVTPTILNEVGHPSRKSVSAHKS